MFFEEEKYWKFNRYPNIELDSKVTPDKPYLLEHVFDLKEGDYVNNPSNCCYFNPNTTLDGLFISSSDDNVVNVTDEYIIAENRGTCTLSVYSESSVNVSEILVTVYNDVLPRTRKRSIHLKTGTMVQLDNFLRHCMCKHSEDCLFEREFWNVYDLDSDDGVLVNQMNSVKKNIHDYRRVLTCFINGEIIYHPDFDSYYNINIKKDINGKSHVEVNVSDGFEKRVKDCIKVCESELNKLNRSRKRIR